MRTRSQSREQRPPPPEGTPVVIEPLRIEYPFQEDPTVEPMADTRTMAQLLQAPHRGDHDKEDPMLIIRTFNMTPPTMRVPNVPIATISLCFFPSLIRGEQKPEYG
ncbi:hypothetical protein Tco_1029104 [Tanacetum coccineum]|uniref:Uncharacterized protein n=1 Tax=Tanacetum coccineum TaxID=301880 RepID=A0ABQ5G409_9ASTR